MLGIFRRLWRTHIAKRDALIAGLQALRSEKSEVYACLSRIDGHLGALIGAHQAGLGELKDAMLSESLRRGVALHELIDAVRTAASSANHNWAMLGMVSSMVAIDGRNADPAALPHHFAQVYSQDGADGIIAEIFRRIGTRDRTFLEIGIENGTQNNTRFLLEQGWRGVWIEGDAASAADAAHRFASYVASGHLRIVARSVEPDDVEAILSDAGVPERSTSCRSTSTSTRRMCGAQCTDVCGSPAWNTTPPSHRQSRSRCPTGVAPVGKERTGSAVA
jgi:hypothetical protein